MSSRSSQRDHGARTLSALKSQPCSVYRLCPTLCSTRSMASTRGKRGWSRREHASLPGPPCDVKPCLHHQGGAAGGLQPSECCSQDSDTHHRFHTAQHCSVSAHLLKLRCSCKGRNCRRLGL